MVEPSAATIAMASRVLWDCEEHIHDAHNRIIDRTAAVSCDCAKQPAGDGSDENGC